MITNIKNLKGIIYDFDGVIADSNDVKKNAFQKMYSKYGEKISIDIGNHHLLNGGMSRYDKLRLYHKKYLNINLSDDSLIELANEFSNIVLDDVVKADYIPGVKEYIYMTQKKYKLFISTGTPTKEIKEILRRRGIDEFFTDVFGSPEKKEKHLKQILSKYKMNPNDLIFFGDSKSDLLAAKTCNINFILIMNAHNTSLQKNFDCKKINDFNELL